MAKIYSKNPIVITTMKPKKEIVSFLLNYSKALSIVKIQNHSFEFNSN